ncbi:MAG: DUF2459 domain-containing protein [Saprospiraceae bacterium]|nr:DUF2459 domain-containing protein [Saprospiraceae bacterium]
MIKTCLKYTKYIAIGIVSFLALYAFLACTLSILGTSPEKHQCRQHKEIYLSTNGVHIDIIIPKVYIDDLFVSDLKIKAPIQFVAFGWGDKGFYLETPTWGDLTFSTAIHAMFWNSETAMHVSRYKNTYSDWKKIPICDKQLQSLLLYIQKSFKKNQNQKIMEIQNSGYSYYDTFYEANGSYSCIQTCNFWVNKGLKRADIKTSIWSPFDRGILYHIPE